MRLLVYGGRDFNDRHDAYTCLDYVTERLLLEDEDVVVVSGMARGADTLGVDWAHERGYAIDPYPADWDKYAKAAGPIRNQQMLDSGIDVAVQFPGGNGTADMRRRLDKAGIPVWELKDME